MRHGGNLTIDVGTATVTDELQQDASLKPGQFNLLTVSDTGSGMDAETVAHIFEPFFTTKPVGAGTGLGLATIYGIAHQCGGTVLVSSSPCGGSTFRVYLPRSSKDVLEKSTTDRGIHRLAGTETILLVDDSAPLRNMMLGVLSQKGYSVLDAADGVTALEISRNYAGTIDLLITDIVMPRMGGVKLAEHIVQERPDIGLIFVTGYATDKYVIPQQRAGRTTTLEKPYGTDALLRIVRGMLDEMKSLQPARR
jgi:CheY-like chemotaxis protein